uniref:Uncharacterized protein n=1 Tax=Coccidioides posadasii RMSCC 3488 TaxID=454284 RepID=A0A0J6FTC4_COCPO|nr:hypothetical protein CPAG_08909 [Coccidioides posadasii RMSCC 3488]
MVVDALSDALKYTSPVLLAEQTYVRSKAVKIFAAHADAGMIGPVLNGREVGEGPQPPEMYGRSLWLSHEVPGLPVCRRGSWTPVEFEPKFGGAWIPRYNPANCTSRPSSNLRPYIVRTAYISCLPLRREPSIEFPRND